MNPLAPSFLVRSSFLQVTRTTIKSPMSSKFCQIRPRSAELAALEHLEKSSKTYNGRNVVNTPATFLIGSSSFFLSSKRTRIKPLLSLDFGQIRLLTIELAAL